MRNSGFKRQKRQFAMRQSHESCSEHGLAVSLPLSYTLLSISSDSRYMRIAVLTQTIQRNGM